jgi:hypothetical protein
MEDDESQDESDSAPEHNHPGRSRESRHYLLRHMTAKIIGLILVNPGAVPDPPASNAPGFFFFTQTTASRSGFRAAHAPASSA